MLLVIFNIFLSSYRAECERQRAKLVKDDSELIGERIVIQREGKASVKANLYVPDNTGDELLTVVFPPTLFILSGQDPISQKAKSYVKDMESAGLNPEVIEYEKAVHSFIESNNPEGAVDSSVDMSDVINPEQESLAREAEATISQWIRMRYAK